MTISTADVRTPYAVTTVGELPQFFELAAQDAVLRTTLRLTSRRLFVRVR